MRSAAARASHAAWSTTSMCGSATASASTHQGRAEPVPVIAVDHLAQLDRPPGAVLAPLLAAQQRLPGLKAEQMRPARVGGGRLDGESRTRRPHIEAILQRAVQRGLLEIDVLDAGGDR